MTKLLLISSTAKLFSHVENVGTHCGTIYCYVLIAKHLQHLHVDTDRSDELIRSKMWRCFALIQNYFRSIAQRLCLCLTDVFYVNFIQSHRTEIKLLGFLFCIEY